MRVPLVACPDCSRDDGEHGYLCNHDSARALRKAKERVVVTAIDWHYSDSDCMHRAEELAQAIETLRELQITPYWTETPEKETIQ